ncbi:MAG: hypothetical protein U9N85_01415 [Bacteroidota bacterium]|nr:hypothetical protein [Bacteroidota bacterium]
MLGLIRLFISSNGLFPSKIFLLYGIISVKLLALSGMSKKKDNVNKGREILWMALSVFVFIAAIHKTVYQGFSESWLFFVLVAVALLMWYIRRSMRKNSE